MESKRNASIELLRIIAMFMIVFLHLLGKTVAIEEISIDSWVYLPVWAMEAICRTGNCIFVLITGYFHQKFSFKVEKILKLWIQVWFYSVGGAIVAKYVLGYELLSGLREVIFPIANREYWFITVYIALYCLTPWLRILINNMTNILWRRLLWTGFLLFSIIPTISFTDSLYTGGVYGIVWFVYLYFVGAYIKNNEERFFGKIKGGRACYAC